MWGLVVAEFSLLIFSFFFASFEVFFPFLPGIFIYCFVYSTSFFASFCSFLGIMSGDLDSSDNFGVNIEESVDRTKAISQALEEVSRLLESTKDSFYAICMDIENATTEDALKAAFPRLNCIIRMIRNSAPEEEHDGLVRNALSSLRMSDRLAESLATSGSVLEAITGYKTLVVKDLNVTLRRKAERVLIEKKEDEDLFTKFLTRPVPQLATAQSVLEEIGASSRGASKPLKRGIAAVVMQDEELTVIPKRARSKIPALASLSRVPGSSNMSGSAKKSVLVTRERLRAGFDDPKGLLDLVGPSTSALDRTKKLELLKSAGYEFNTQGESSFTDKLNDASLRLEVGLGGQSVADSLLFGAKVLSCPGFLTPKNISDIENNVVEAKTSWKHQNAYGKMMIAGCLCQAKRIVQKYDDVLFGPAPEVLVQETHGAIRELLLSEEARSFLSSATAGNGESLIKKIVEAVAPIVPIALRDKSLDGAYLRTALHLLGATEVLFAQYESDVRMQANPAGVVGMCASMHAELKRAAVYNEELKSLQDFIKEMRSQYQTSLGLGTPFSKDVRRPRRRNRSFRGRNQFRHSGYRGQGVNRFEQSQLDHFNAGEFSTQGRQQTMAGGLAMQTRPSFAGRGRGLCYDYQAGNCRRGASCRFQHLNQ